MTSISRPGSISNFLFDKNSFVTNIAHKKNSGDIINSFSYTRDALGNRTSITSQRGIASFGYDSESQLTGVTNTEVTGDYAGEVFSYDDLGNRLLDQLGQFNYDNKSQRLTSDYKYNYLYDNNGNLTQKSEKGLTGNFVNYTYSSENQLVKIEEYKNNVLQKTSSYFYDASGRRFKKEVVDHQNSANSYARKYQYDGQEILAELDEYNSTLVVYTHSTLRTDDVLSADIRSTKLANEEGSYFYLKDALGSIIDVADSSGNLVQHYAYSAFGKILSIEDQNGVDVIANPLIKTSYTYTNREYDEESGMYYYRARFYNTDSGRFLSNDPYHGDISNPMTIYNRYIYVLNNPIRLADPFGESALDIFNVHGNYCGPTAVGQDVDEYGNIYDQDPEDTLDRTCRNHDNAYATINRATNLNWEDSWRRVETDFGLVYRGTEYMKTKPIEGFLVAVFGTVMLTYSIPMAGISGVLTFVGSLFGL